MRLKYQMLLTLLIISTLMIGLMFAINSWSFSRGFLGYINTLEMQRLEPLIEELGQRYQRQGSWEWLRNNRREFRQLLAAHVLGRSPNATRKQKRAGADPESNPPVNREGRTEAGNGRRRPAGPPLTIDPRVLVADADMNVLVGGQRNRQNVSWQPIRVQEQTVGYLGIQKKNRVTTRLDKVFEQQQKKAFAYAALAMFAVSALLALPLAARVVKPLLRVNSAVDAISQGDYATRLDLQRKDEFGDLARNVNHLATTLEKNLAARQRWIAEISHELRTPVAVLRAELEALQDGVRRVDDETVSSLHAEALRLHRLIDDLHDLSLSDLGALNFEMAATDLSAVITAFLQDQQSAINDADLVLESDVAKAGMIMSADRQRLEQLLNNLLQNSLRYTDPSGSLSVRLAADAEWITLVWEDSAPGVSDEQLAQLFEPLYRADSSRNRASGGAGLGLSIVKKLVESHSGRIAASHGARGGLRLAIDFPRRQGGLT